MGSNTLTPLPQGWEAWDQKRLEEEIQEHNTRYWDHETPTISDYDYDRLVERLKERDPQSSVLNDLGPSMGLIGDPVEHERPMLSLDKCYDEANLLKWSEQFEGPVIMTPKVDGVACSLRYNPQGKLLLAATRGDGSKGESITANVVPMDTIPKQLAPDAFAPFVGQEVEIRGEVYMSLAAFERLKDRFSNPRNATAGTLKRKESRNAQAVGLKFYAYDVFGVEGKNASERLDLAQSWGFDPVPYQVLKRDELQEGYEGYVRQRAELDYEIDGVVYRAERTDEYDRLGANSHHPRGAIAYKLQGESAQTTLKAVEWSVSRNGLLTPVGMVAPVSLSGAMVSRITLHNWGMVKSKNLSVGAKVIAMRRGGVIPHLETVVEAGECPVEAPSRCPQCPRLNAPTEVVGDQVFCRYEGTCDAQAAAILKHYVSTTKIEGFGQVWLDTLTQHGILNTPLDLYALTEKKVLGLEGVGRTRARSWIKSIDQARKLPLATFLTALGINDLGKNMAKALSNHFKSLDAIRATGEEQIAELNGFGELTAKSIVQGLKARSALIDALLQEVELEEVKEKLPSIQGNLLKDKSFLFTGTLVAMKRTEAQDKVVELGGKNASTVSKKLSYLVVGDAGKAGSKLTKAGNLGIPVLKESEFLALIYPPQDEDLDSNTLSTFDEDLNVQDMQDMQDIQDVQESPQSTDIKKSQGLTNIQEATETQETQETTDSQFSPNIRKQSNIKRDSSSQDQQNAQTPQQMSLFTDEV